MGTFTVGGITYEELPNGKARVVSVAQQAVDPNPIKVREANTGIARDQATTGRTIVQTQGDQIDNRIRDATSGATIRKANADAMASELAAKEAQVKIDALNRQTANGGLPADKVAELRANLTGLDDFGRTVASLRQQYNDNFKGGGVGALAEYLPAFLRPANGVFNDTAGALRTKVTQAQGLQARQFDTPKEQQMFMAPLTPSSWDTDAQTENKLRTLEGMVNTGRQKILAQAPGLAPQDPRQVASQALQREYRSYTDQTKDLPALARQVGLKKLQSDPRMKRLWGIVNGQGGGKQPGVIDFNDLP